MPLEASVRQISRTTNMSEFCFATDRGLYFAFLTTEERVQLVFRKEHYFKNKMINKVYEYKPQWFMVFEHAIPNSFSIVSRLSKEVTETVNVFLDQPS